MKKSKLLVCLMAALCLAGCGTSWDNYYQLNKDDYTVHFSEVRASTFRKERSADLPSSGDVKGLVIPVQFRDKTCASLTNYGGCEGIRNDIQATLFGDGSGTNWESLASFYRKSSYENLRITGEVSEWYTASMTAAQFGQGYGSNGGGGATLMLDEAIAWYKNNHTEEHMRQFDSNGDGHLDAVWLIYSVEPHWNNYNELFWAFVYWNQGTTPNVQNPTPFAFMWASYDFLYENAETVDGKLLPDAHTFIHETGHLLGLTDYYNYDSSDHNAWGPAGGLDMMDYNIGDHNAYSKSLLEWVEPLVVTGNANIKLRPFESSGDCVIIAPQGYKGSILDEYLIVEYYTPTGLNEYDSIHRYAGTYPLMFTEPGIKIYHVDSRIGGYRRASDSYKFGTYVETIDSRFEYIDIVNENSPSRSGVPTQKLLQLLESSGENSFINGARASNATLFKEGDTLGYKNGPFEGFTLHKEVSYGVPMELGYRLKVVKISPEEAELRIEKI